MLYTTYGLLQHLVLVSDTMTKSMAGTRNCRITWLVIAYDIIERLMELFCSISPKHVFSSLLLTKSYE